MKVVFMGTPDFAVPCIQALMDHGHQVDAVITQPDKAKGRGKTVQMTPVKERALNLGLSVYQPVKVRDPEFVEFLKELAPEVIVVVAFGQILPKSILDLPTYGCINVHASLLPKFRGAAPIQWAVIEGEKESGVTTMFMDVGLDTGDMLKKAVIPLDARETGGSLHDKLSVLGAELLIETLDDLENHRAVREPQDDSQAGAYARMLDKHMGLLDFSNSAKHLECLIRGLNPWPSAYTKFNGKTLKLWAADVIDTEAEGSCGQVVAVGKDYLHIKTGEGLLSVTELQPEGKKRMAVDAFLRGYPVAVGTILG